MIYVFSVSLSLLYSSSQEEECDNISPQTVYYEQVIPLELSNNPKFDAESNPNDPLSLQLVQNTAYVYVGSKKHPQP